MFRRRRKGSGGADDAAAEAGATDGEVDAPPPEPGDAVPPGPEPAEAYETADDDGAAEEAPAPAPVSARSGPGDGDGDYGPGYVGDHLPVSVWVESVLDTRPPPSREELERQAAADFQAAIAPSLEKLREVVPEAASPEEARRVLEERQGELLPDPEGETLRANDIFKTEATVHHRIQKQLERPRGRVGWGRPWEPPAGLARQTHDSGRRSLPRGGT
jgi:hypothetical protein